MLVGLFKNSVTSVNLQWAVSQDIIGSAQPLEVGQLADQRAALRTNGPRRKTGIETEAGGSAHVVGTVGVPGPETESEPDAQGAENEEDQEAEIGGGQAAGTEEGDPPVPARAEEQMKSQGAKRKTPLIRHLIRKRQKRRKRMTKLMIKTLTRINWRRR